MKRHLTQEFRLIPNEVRREIIDDEGETRETSQSSLTPFVTIGELPERIREQFDHQLLLMFIICNIAFKSLILICISWLIFYTHATVVVASKCLSFAH